MNPFCCNVSKDSFIFTFTFFFIFIHFCHLFLSFSIFFSSSSHSLINPLLLSCLTNVTIIWPWFFVLFFFTFLLYSLFVILFFFNFSFHSFDSAFSLTLADGFSLSASRYFTCSVFREKRNFFLTLASYYFFVLSYRILILCSCCWCCCQYKMHYVWCVKLNINEITVALQKW